MMKASDVRAPARMLPFGLALCLCLPVLLWSPATAEPTTHSSVRVVALVATAPSIATPELPAPPPEPATVHVVLTRGQKRLELELPFDGKVPADTADAIARMMRCPTSGRTRRIASGTLALLADVAARYPGREIEVVSAVRGEPERTRDGIKHSKHWDGHAIDIIVRGAKLSEVRDAMWKNHRDIGLGWYPTGGFIHLDYRPDVHDTAWTQPRPNADNQYHPRWARVARDTSDDAGALRAKIQLVLARLMPSLANAFGYNEARIIREPRNS